MNDTSLFVLVRRGVLTLAVLSFLFAVVAGPAASASRGTAKQLAATPKALRQAGVADRCKKKHRKTCRKKPAYGALRPKTSKAPKAPPPSRLAGLPASVDLRTYAVPAGNQGSIGSCVTWAIDYGMLGWYSRHDGRPGQPFQPMYTFSQIHGANGNGSQPADALNVALNQGNDTAAHYQHAWDDWQTQPNASERANAAKFKIAGWHTLFSNSTLAGGGAAGITQLETELAAGQPVAIEMRVRPGFNALMGRSAASVQGATDADISGTLAGSNPTPLHEVLALGYDSVGLIIENSWGQTFGSKGFARLTWAVVSKDIIAAHYIDGFAPSATPPPNPPPTMNGVVQQFPLDGGVTDTTTPMKFSWSASGALGVAGYEVYVRTDSGDYWKQDIPANSTDYKWALAFGHTYRVAVRARDTAGHWSDYAYSAQVSPNFADDTVLGDVSSPWQRLSLTSALGGSYVASSDPGSWVQYTFTGIAAAFIPVKFSSAGRATIFCDGGSSAVGDYYSASTATRQIGGTCHFGQYGQHTIRISAEGTSGRPWLGVDAFVTY